MNTFGIYHLIQIAFSFVIAWVLMILPLPYEIHWFRPEWINLVLIYWVMREPHLVGVGTAFSVGLIMDGLRGLVLGQTALAMTIIAYLTHSLRRRLQLHFFWQQALCILVLVGLGQLTLLLIRWLIGHPPETLLVWSSTLTSVLLWPLVFHFLRFYGRKTFD